jgi:hypothetical protein
MTANVPVMRYQQRVSGSGITGDEFQYIETVPATDFDAVVAESDALRRDAQRYRWLRDENVERAFLPQATQYKKSAFNISDRVAVYGDELDAAIDAAIKAMTSPAEEEHYRSLFPMLREDGSVP